MSQKPDFLFRPANASQAVACAAWKDSDVLILTGPPGSGKTHLAIGLAAQEVMNGKAEQVVLSRPVVTAGEDIGFLPGRLEQKMHPWLLPVHDVLKRMTFQKPDQWVKENCEVAPLAFMRGRTFSRSVAVLDEAQNASYAQLRLFLTRLGDKGRLILSGDWTQADRPDSGFARVVRAFTERPLKRVSVVSLNDVQNPRHDLIPHIIERLP